MRDIEAKEDDIKMLIEDIIQKIPTKGQRPMTEKECNKLKEEIKEVMVDLVGDYINTVSTHLADEVKNWNIDVLKDQLPPWKIIGLQTLQTVLKNLDNDIQVSPKDNAEL